MHMNKQIINKLGGELYVKSLIGIGSIYIFNVNVKSAVFKKKESKRYIINSDIRSLVKYTDSLSRSFSPTIKTLSDENINQIENPQK